MRKNKINYLLVFFVVMRVPNMFGSPILQDSVLNSIDSTFFQKKIHFNIKYVYFVNEKMDFPLVFTTGLIDSILKVVPNVEELSICNISLKSVPAEISKLEKLKELTLGSCQLTEIPEILFNLKSLISLDLTGNPIAEIPTINIENNNLASLSFAATHIKEVPNSICNLKNLKTLILDANKNTIKLPNCLIKLDSLANLSFMECKIKKLPKIVYKLKHIKLLNLIGTGIECKGVLKRFNYNFILECWSYRGNRVIKSKVESSSLFWQQQIPTDTSEQPLEENTSKKPRLA